MTDPREDHSIVASLLEANQSSQRGPARVMRADIRSITSTGHVEVVPVDGSVQPFACDILESAFSRETRLEPGDIVLVLSPGSSDEPGCVLGRIATYQPAEKLAKRVVIEAADELTLKCGDCSLDLRKDGKLMIRGKDVLTRAKRTQRIKGGTVAIN